MKEGKNCDYEKKGAYKTAKSPLVKKKKQRKADRERAADFGENQ